MTNIFLLAILLLGSFLRLYRLSSLPISLFGDEIDVGYHAWSLFTTGRDYLGNLLPTYIHSLSEWRAPLLMYLTAPFVGLLSPSTFSVRLPVALMGIFNLYLIYRLGKRLFSSKVGLFSALILAITPWHIHYSRASFEVTLLTTLILSATILFLSKKYFWAIILFVLTLYTYSVANLFVPLLIILLLFLFRPEKIHFSSVTLTKSIIVLIILLPIVYHLTFGAAAGRFGLISIFNDQKVVEKIILARTDPWVDNNRLEKLFHNKVWGYASAFGKSYLTAFSTDFLFVNGDPNFRQSISHFGELLWVSAPFLLLGLALIINKKDSSSRFVLAWLLISPLSSSLTQGGGNHATRLFVMLPALAIITALGFEAFWKSIHNSKMLPKALTISVLVVLVSINLVGYWHRYEEHYRFESARVWNHGYDELFTKLKSLDGGSGKVFINNTYNPSFLRFAFYTQLSPITFQKNFLGDVSSENLLPHFNGFQFGDRYFFGQVDHYDNLSGLLTKGDLYVAVQGIEIPGDWDWGKNPPAGIKTLYEEKDVLGQPLFYILSKDI